MDYAYVRAYYYINYIQTGVANPKCMWVWVRGTPLVTGHVT